MKIEPRLPMASAVFFAVIAVVYWFTSYEPAGTAMLGFAVAAWVFLGAYLLRVRREVGVRPEDRDDGTFAQGAGAIGYFPSSSAWPLGMGVGAVVLVNGLVFGIWLVVAGAALFIFSTVGLVIESYGKV